MSECVYDVLCEGYQWEKMKSVEGGVRGEESVGENESVSGGVSAVL